MVPEYLYFAARLCKLYKLCKEMVPEFLYSAARLCELYKLCEEIVPEYLPHPLLCCQATKEAGCCISGQITIVMLQLRLLNFTLWE